MDAVLSKDLEVNLKQIKDILKNCSDVVYREFLFAQNERIRLALIYIDGLADTGQISDQIMRALALEVPLTVSGRSVTKAGALEFIKQRALYIPQLKETNQLEDIIHAILSGESVLLVDGCATGLVNGVKGWEARSVGKAETESIVRGPRESFVETLQVNTALIRRKIKSPNLKIETSRIGEVSDTDVALVYIEGIVNEKLVTEVKSRLERIKVDAILESGYIEELIEDNPWSLFPTVNHTDKPDRVAAMLLEGRVAIMVDGSPTVLTLPNLFVEYLQAPQDYYERSLFSTAIRSIRYLAMIISLILSSLYIAIISFHHELLPTSLLLGIVAHREVVPFPIFFEVLIMEVAFEILREAGNRLSQLIGPVVSIGAALLLGEVAVREGVIAASTVFVVVFAGLASYAFAYSASMSFRLLRFAVIVLSGMLGLVGLISGITLIIIHLCTLRSFGVPYMSPLAPTTGADLADVVYRAPWWAADTRPRFMARKNKKRQGLGLKPTPPKNKRQGGRN